MMPDTFRLEVVSNIVTSFTAHGRRSFEVPARPRFYCGHREELDADGHDDGGDTPSGYDVQHVAD